MRSRGGGRTALTPRSAWVAKRGDALSAAKVAFEPLTRVRVPPQLATFEAIEVEFVAGDRRGEFGSGSLNLPTVRRAHPVIVPPAQPALDFGQSTAASTSMGALDAEEINLALVSLEWRASKRSVTRFFKLAISLRMVSANTRAVIASTRFLRNG